MADVTKFTSHVTSSRGRPGSVGGNSVPSPAYMEHMKSEFNRLKSYTNWSPFLTQRPRELAHSGLFYTNISDRVQCPFCYGVLKKWLPSDKPRTEHSRHFPYCRFIRGLDVGNIPILSNLQPYIMSSCTTCNEHHYRHSSALNIVPPFATNIDISSGKQILVCNSHGRHSSVNIDYTLEENRLKTFSRWPSGLSQHPSELARAGFYLSPCEGKPDRVTCAYCKGKVSKWEPHDDPWLEHKRSFPNCPYIKLCMGDDEQYPNKESHSTWSVQRERQSIFPHLADLQPWPQTTHLNTDHDDNLNLRMESDSVQAILAMGYQRDIVRRVVKKYLQIRPRSFPSAEELASMVMELEDLATAAPTATPPLTPFQRPKTVVSTSKNTIRQNINSHSVESNTNKRNNRLLCKICMENQVRVTFMPCGHLACCGPCSLDLRECPICRTRITKCVRTYF